MYCYHTCVLNQSHSASIIYIINVDALLHITHYNNIAIKVKRIRVTYSKRSTTSKPLTSMIDLPSNRE